MKAYENQITKKEALYKDTLRQRAAGQYWLSIQPNWETAYRDRGFIEGRRGFVALALVQAEGTLFQCNL